MACLAYQTVIEKIHCCRDFFLRTRCKDLIFNVFHEVPAWKASEILVWSATVMTSGMQPEPRVIRHGGTTTSVYHGTCVSWDIAPLSSTRPAERVIVDCLHTFGHRRAHRSSQLTTTTLREHNVIYGEVSANLYVTQDLDP